MKKIILAAIAAASVAPMASAQKFELLPFGNMDQWMTREIKESAILGGHTKNVYEIAPEKTV